MAATSVLVAGVGAGQEWEIEEIGVGTKPSLVVDESGRPHVAYMTEALAGGVFYAVRDRGVWSVEQAVSGYFYAPMDLALDADGQPHIYYHDHQSMQFQPALGDAVVVHKSGEDWVVETLVDPGHDGWDGSVAVDAGGDVHVVAIDPVQFGGTSGVEYYVRTGGSWSVQEIGSGPIPYEFGTDLVIDSQGRPHVVFHDGTEARNASGSGSDLKYAVLTDEGWQIQVVDANGDVGKFASLALDSSEQPHISYLDWQDETSGQVKYAHLSAEGVWETEIVGDVDALSLGFIGARKTTSLALDAADRPHIAYAGRFRLHYAEKVEDDTWSIQKVIGPTGGDMELGQLASMALDASGRVHITYYELPLNPSNSTGTVLYATRQVVTAVLGVEAAGDTPADFELEQNFPNPFNAGTTIPFELARAGEVELAVYDLGGRLVRVLEQGMQGPGRHRISWDGRDTAGFRAATGVYFMRLRSNEGEARLRKVLLLR